MTDKIILGEKIQQLADVYIGYEADFMYNPFIANEKHKHKLFNDIPEYYDNPKIIFCYTHNLKQFSSMIRCFLNRFILITHNSDTPITDQTYIHSILWSHKLIHWYSQNVCIHHAKLTPIPIGIANSMWSHSNLNFYSHYYSQQETERKKKKVYMNFSVGQNEIRIQCYDKLKNRIPFMNMIDSYQNLERMSEYEFCICPEGNGTDTHRLWEALYLKCVPIVVHSAFIDVLKRYCPLLPMIVLNNWDEYDESMLDYVKYKDFFGNMNLSVSFYKSEIENKLKMAYSLFDIVIPVGPNEVEHIDKQIEFTKKNIHGYHCIYLIATDPNLNIDDCITIYEKTYFSTIVNYMKNKNYYLDASRNGWYLQQLLKLYAGTCIPHIMDTYLVIDSDTFFLKPTRFLSYEPNNRVVCCYNVGDEYNYPYFKHMALLHPSLEKVVAEYSGICHHMMFEQKYIKQLFELVETNHHKDFYKVFLDHIDVLAYSSASEYEIYFNYMLKHHPHDIKIRRLKWTNNNTTIDKKEDFDYISVHHYNDIRHKEMCLF